MLCMLKHTLFSCVCVLNMSLAYTRLAKFNAAFSLKVAENCIYSCEMHKKTVATCRAAPFGPDIHQIVCQLGLRPRPHWGSL